MEFMRPGPWIGPGSPPFKPMPESQPPDTESRTETRETWVDLSNTNWTRSQELRSAWADHGRDLAPSDAPIPVDPVFPNRDMLVGAIRPWWLNSPDGTLSFSELVFRFTDRALYAAQADHARATHASSEQETLLAATDPQGVLEASQ